MTQKSAYATYNMLADSLNFENFCKENSEIFPELLLSVEEWKCIHELTEVLKAPKIATIKLQSEQLTAGDAFLVWQECLVTLKRQTHAAAKLLVTSMEVREAKLLSSPVLIAALYLDPRCQILLSKSQKEMAVNHLVALWVKIEKLELKFQDSDTNNSVNNGPGPSSLDDQGEEVDDPVEQLLRNKEKESRLEQLRHCETRIEEVRGKIINFASVPRISKKENILQYWEGQSHMRPDLYKIAKIALAVAPCQVSVERLFSGVKFILNCLRFRLGPQKVNDILFVRTNHLFKK